MKNDLIFTLDAEAETKVDTKRGRRYHFNPFGVKMVKNKQVDNPARQAIAVNDAGKTVPNGTKEARIGHRRQKYEV